MGISSSAAASAKRTCCARQRSGGMNEKAAQLLRVPQQRVDGSTSMSHPAAGVFASSWGSMTMTMTMTIYSTHTSIVMMGQCQQRCLLYLELRGQSLIFAATSHSQKAVLIPILPERLGVRKKIRKNPREATHDQKSVI